MILDGWKTCYSGPHWKTQTDWTTYGMTRDRGVWRRMCYDRGRYWNLPTERQRQPYTDSVSVSVIWWSFIKCPTSCVKSEICTNEPILLSLGRKDGFTFFSDKSFPHKFNGVIVYYWMYFAYALFFSRPISFRNDIYELPLALYIFTIFGIPLPSILIWPHAPTSVCGIYLFISTNIEDVQTVSYWLYKGVTCTTLSTCMDFMSVSLMTLCFATIKYYHMYISFQLRSSRHIGTTVICDVGLQIK